MKLIFFLFGLAFGEISNVDGLNPPPVFVSRPLEKRQTVSNSNFSYLTLSQTLFNAHVRARTNPLGFAQELAAFGDLAASYIAGNATKTGGLLDNAYLRKAGQVLVLDQNSTGLIGHIGSNGSTPWSRMNQFGTWQIVAGENIAYGPSTSLGVMSILIKSALHFANIYRPSFTLLGVFCGPHPNYVTSCVFDFTGGFIPN